ncbi:hypothetical protein NYR90_00430 [Clostridioides difficile]|nr:hypothetical protein NYR90_00430 [Clostridioides difficile]
MKNKKFNVITLIIVDNYIGDLKKEHISSNLKTFTLKTMDFSIIIS